LTIVPIRGNLLAGAGERKRGVREGQTRTTLLGVVAQCDYGPYDFGPLADRLPTSCRHLVNAAKCSSAHDGVNTCSYLMVSMCGGLRGSLDGAPRQFARQIGFRPHRNLTAAVWLSPPLPTYYNKWERPAPSEYHLTEGRPRRGCASRCALCVEKLESRVIPFLGGCPPKNGIHHLIRRRRSWYNTRHEN
jgi:hypothetical protein